MVLPLVIAGISAAASAASSIYSAQQQNKANKIQQAIADNKAANERRQQIRQARLARGRLVNASAQTGGQGSSAETGALSGISSQLGFNLSESFATQAMSGRITSLMGRAANAQMAGNIFQSVGNLAMYSTGKP